MGVINKILSVFSSFKQGVATTEIKGDSGGLEFKTMENYSQPGEDSKPLLTDYAVAVDAEGSGKRITIGFIDPINLDISKTGEKRIYSRNDLGVIVAEIFLTKDGKINLSNDSGFINLTSTGIIELNGFTDNAVRYNALNVAFQSLIVSVNAAIASAIAGHTHAGVLPGIGTSGAGSGSGSPVVGDISASKVNEVELP